MVQSFQPSGTIEDDQLIPPRDPIPGYPGATLFYAPHSHSIVLSHRNALHFRRNFFCARSSTASSIRQKFALLIPKVNLHNPRPT
jgi:hypothetical protein